jgi:hypothetical protein
MHLCKTFDELSAELLYSYVHEIALPLLDEEKAELVDESYTIEQLLHENQLPVRHDYIPMDENAGIQVRATPKVLLRERSRET